MAETGEAGATTTTSRCNLVQESSGRRGKRCCCNALQYRAFFLISVSTVFILVAEFFDVAGYLVFVGSVGIFFGFFMIMLDVSLYIQHRNEDRIGRRRFGARDEEEGNVWSTSLNATSSSRSPDINPPDYETTMEQPDLFPIQSYLEDGVPLSMTSSSSNPTITITDEGSTVHDNDKLPSYEEVMEGSLAAPSSHGDTGPET